MVIIDETHIPSSIHILIVDDVQDMRDQLKKDLLRMGFEGNFLEAENVEQALVKVLDPRVAFVLSDWNMPDGTGLRFLTGMRRTGALDTIPFVMITTEDGVSHMLEAIRSGADQYLVKPWSYEDLRSKIAFAWDKRIKK